MRTLMLVFGAMFSINACEKDAGEDGKPAADVKTPTCDKLAQVLEMCIEKLENPSQAAILKDSLKQNKEAWKENKDKAKLESSCRQAWDNAKKEVGAFCPGVSWD